MSPEPVGAVAAAMVVRAGRVFLARRSGHKGSPGLWELPGGKLEDGESADAPGFSTDHDRWGCFGPRDIPFGSLAPMGDGVLRRWVREAKGAGTPPERSREEG